MTPHHETSADGQRLERVAPEVVETHISTVCFVGDRAYKLLKPLTTSFLDFSTTEKRIAAVTQEIELNRRLAPEVYLGHADVVEAGQVVDRMIVMRRLPADRRLTAMLGHPEVGECVRSIARTVAAFHAAQEPLLDAEAIAGRTGLLKNWTDNFDDIEPLVGDVLQRAEVERARHLVRQFLDHREPLLRQRMADGLVRDGHGDLTASDIFCLDEGPQILDCLAFDPKLRIADVLLDVAFLVMDLDRLAGSRLSSAFLRWYCEFSNEHHPAALAHHYVAYRAHVRAKVEGLRYRQGDASAAAAVRAYHHLCVSHLERAQLTVTLVGGTPGTGKSTLARGLSGAFGSMLLTTDELRKDLAGRPHLDHEVAKADEGIYTPSMSDLTYQTLLQRAGAARPSRVGRARRLVESRGTPGGRPSARRSQGSGRHRDRVCARCEHCEAAGCRPTRRGYRSLRCSARAHRRAPHPARAMV
ncbi:MAG: hypothetical protein R2710_28390 [Acidimicrobiales bacterium]